MARWNNDLTLDSENLLRDLSNAVLLRSDIHNAFDQRRFVFFPKVPGGFVVHMLEPTIDLGQLYHNTRVNIPYCSIQFLFARFAWSLFPSLSAFLSRPARTRLVIRLKPDGERVVEEVLNPLVLARKSAASRSNSPTKRSRIAADIGNELYTSQERGCVPEPARGRSLLRSTPPTLQGDSESDAHTQKESNFLQGTVPVGISTTEDARIQKLKRDALALQRPVQYPAKRPKYDRHRPAREELELMGVEIMDELDSLDGEL
jgi:hypothetical protein